MDGIIYIVYIVLLVPLASKYIGVFGSPPTFERCSHVTPFLSKQDAMAFTRSVRVKRDNCAGKVTSHPVCTDEPTCECNKRACVNEDTRRLWCAMRHSPCPAGTFCFLSTPCPAHFTTSCTDTCKHLYPEEGELVFVADSSLSVGQTFFDNQKQFMKNFLQRFPIGPNAFQVAVVSYSLTATIHCHLNTHHDIHSLMSVINSMSHTGGPSFTGSALRLVSKQVLTIANGRRQNRRQYVVVLTDGLSSDVTETSRQARLLRDMGAEIIVVAIGSQINHFELLDIASKRLDVSQIYTPLLPDALYSVLKRHMPNCPDCTHNSTDVIVLFDAATDHGVIKNALAIDALKTFIEGIPIGPGNVHVSYIKYAKSVYEEFDFSFGQTVDNVMIYIGQHTKQLTGPANLSRVLDHVTNNGFGAKTGSRSPARKFVVVFLHSISDDYTAVRTSADALKRSGVTMATVGVGYTNMTSLLELASDPALAFSVGDDINIPNSVLSAMAGSMEFDVCN